MPRKYSKRRNSYKRVTRIVKKPTAARARSLQEHGIDTRYITLSFLNKFDINLLALDESHVNGVNIVKQVFESENFRTIKNSYDSWRVKQFRTTYQYADTLGTEDRKEHAWANYTSYNIATRIDNTSQYDVWAEPTFEVMSQYPNTKIHLWSAGTKPQISIAGSSTGNNDWLVTNKAPDIEENKVAFYNPIVEFGLDRGRIDMAALDLTIGVWERTVVVIEVKGTQIIRPIH